MDELNLISEDRPGVPAPSPDLLATARARLIAEARQEPVADRTNRRSRWWIWASAASVIGTVALGVTLLLAPSQNDEPGTGTGPAATPVKLVDAVQVLHNAAAAALKEPDIAPRPDQFVYTRYADGRQIWRSADGSQDGLIDTSNGSRTILPACRDGRSAKLDKTGAPTSGVEPCGAETAAYNPNLPTDPDTLLRALNDNMPYDPAQPGDVNRVGKGIMALMQDSYVRPQVQAALFEAATQIPGLRVDPDATDGAGRTGVGIAWSYSGTNELIFDATSHAFLGVTTTANNGAKGSASVIQVAIVDQAGQLPTN